MKQLDLGAEEGEGLGLTRQSKGCCSLSHRQNTVWLGKLPTVSRWQKVEGSEDSQGKQQ